MSCDWEARVSAFVDGELEAEERNRVEAHVAGCPDCRQMLRDLEHLSEKIRSYEVPPGRSTEEALQTVLTTEETRTPLWRRRIAVPLPLAAAATLAIVFLGAWASFQRLGPASGPPRPTAIGIARDADASVLDRYDRGQPALLYTVRREDR